MLHLTVANSINLNMMMFFVLQSPSFSSSSIISHSPFTHRISSIFMMYFSSFKHSFFSIEIFHSFFWEHKNFDFMVFVLLSFTQVRLFPEILENFELCELTS